MKKPWMLLGYGVLGALGIWLTAKVLLPVGLPFLLGFVLARLARRPSEWLHRRAHFPRCLASVLSITLLSATLLGLLWLLGRVLVVQAERWAARLPGLFDSLRPSLAALRESLLRLVNKLPGSIAEAAAGWLDRLFRGSTLLAETLSGWVMGFAGNLIAFVPDLVLFLITTLLSAYLFISEAPLLRSLWKKMAPELWRERLAAMKSRLRSALGGYCKAQAYLILVTFFLLMAGLFLLRQPHPLLLALIIAAVDALPVFGAGIILLPWAAVAFLQGNTFLGVGLALLYALVAVSRALLEPKFLGKQIGLHPLLTLLALYAGFRLFGVLGMLLVPVGVILLKQLYDIVEPGRA